jgi:hypothetical protein
MRVEVILQELTDEIRVESRDVIELTLFVPEVRPPSGSMNRDGIESPTQSGPWSRQLLLAEFAGPRVRSEARPTPQAGLHALQTVPPSPFSSGMRALLELCEAFRSGVAGSKGDGQRGR